MRVHTMRLAGVLCALVLAPTHALGWTSQGHQAIAEAAQARLTPAAEAALARILVGRHRTTLPPGALATASTWADEIRMLKGLGPAIGWSTGDVDEAMRFNAAHPANARWHFVNLPLGASGYPTTADTKLRRFTSPDDIVHALNRAIAVLESPRPPPDYSRAQAVRWIVHLVGDIHQPFHVTAGYYAATPGALAHPTILRDPEEAARPGVVTDRGGNGLKFPTGDGVNLHALWDACLVQRVNGEPCEGGDRASAALARKLAAWAKAPAAAPYRPTGPHLEWAAQWATDTLKAAVAAAVYDVQLSAGRVTDLGLEATIVAPGPDAYADARIAAAREQLVKATVRLAELLNRIDWK